MQYGLSESLRIGLAGSYVYGAASEPASTGSSTTGWTNPSLSITKDVHSSSDEIASVSLGFAPRSGNTTLNKFQSAAISGRYAKVISDDAWVSLAAAYLVQPGAYPDTALTSLSLVVASRMIVRTFYKQMRMRSVPVFHGPHWGFALERRLG